MKCQVVCESLSLFLAYSVLCKEGHYSVAEFLVALCEDDLDEFEKEFLIFDSERWLSGFYTDDDGVYVWGRVETVSGYVIEQFHVGSIVSSYS